MSMSRLQALARKLESQDEAWARFDEDQAAREAEIRRPAKHINVMSNEEWDRKEKAKEIVKTWFQELVNMRLEQLRLTEQLIFQLFGRLEGNDLNDEQREAIHRVSKGISAALVLRCQSKSDPYVPDASELDASELDTSEPDASELDASEKPAQPDEDSDDENQRVPRLETRQLNAYTDFETIDPHYASTKRQSLSTFAAHQLHLSVYSTPGFGKKTTKDILREKGPLSDDVISQLKKDFEIDMSESELTGFDLDLVKAGEKLRDDLRKKALENPGDIEALGKVFENVSEADKKALDACGAYHKKKKSIAEKYDHYPSKAEKKVLGDFFADEDAQKAMKVILNKSALAFNPFAQILRLVIRKGDSCVPEGREPLDKEHYEKELKGPREESHRFPRSLEDLEK